jgi:hypothetical protein
VLHRAIVAYGRTKMIARETLACYQKGVAWVEGGQPSEFFH